MWMLFTQQVICSFSLGTHQVECWLSELTELVSKETLCGSEVINALG